MSESEVYIRDHLLIEFMIDYVYSHMRDKPEPVEYIYEAWIAWLKEMEEKHGKQN